MFCRLHLSFAERRTLAVDWKLKTRICSVDYTCLLQKGKLLLQTGNWTRICFVGYTCLLQKGELLLQTGNWKPVYVLLATLVFCRKENFSCRLEIDNPYMFCWLHLSFAERKTFAVDQKLKTYIGSVGYTCLLQKGALLL